MTDFDVLLIFTCSISIGTMLGFMGGYKLGCRSGATQKRAEVVAGMNALLESEDLKIYVKKDSTFQWSHLFRN